MLEDARLNRTPVPPAAMVEQVLHCTALYECGYVAHRIIPFVVRYLVVLPIAEILRVLAELGKSMGFCTDYTVCALTGAVRDG